MNNKKITLKNPFKGIISYFQEVIIETKKIAWPSRKETVQLTLIVIVTGTFISIFVSFVDFILKTILEKIV